MIRVQRIASKLREVNAGIFDIRQQHCRQTPGKGIFPIISSNRLGRPTVRFRSCAGQSYGLRPFHRFLGVSSNRPLERGDVIIAESTPAYDGQFGQICRSASVGAPSDVLSEKYKLLVRAMAAGIEKVRPGVTVSEVACAVDAVLIDAGYEEKYNHPPYMNRRSHGMGAGSIAPGDIAVENPTILEEDMVFVVHPNQYLPETGYLLCGEPVRVTATGYESLSRKWAELGVVGA